MTFGIIYTAIVGSSEYVEWAAFSAKTAKAHMPDVRTSIYTNKPAKVKRCKWGKYVDEIIKAPDYDAIDWHGAKIGGILASEDLEYDVTLFADCDTVFCGSVQGVFELMATGKFDLALTMLRNQHKRQYPLRGVPKAFSYYSSGVFFFPWNAATRKFFQDWRAAFSTHKLEFPETRRKKDTSMHRDMPAFNEALYENSNLRLVFLPRNYNETFWTGCSYGPVKILHVHGAGGEKLMRMAKRINANSGQPRLYRNREIL